MAQKALTTEKIEEMRSLRSQGLSVHDVAAQAGVSEGTASNYTRDIKKPARSSQGHKRAPKAPVVTSSIVDEGGKGLGKVPVTEAVVELANEVKEAELNARLRRLRAEEEEERQRREDTEGLRKRLKEAETREAEARAKSYSSAGPEVMAQIETAKAEAQRLREQLTEQRHQEQMGELRRGFESQVGALAELFRDRSGLGRFDIMAKGMDKLDKTIMLAGTKVDSFLSTRRRDGDFELALKLGLSPEELEILKRGLEMTMTRRQYDIMRDDRTELEYGSYESWVAQTEQHNQRYRQLSARVSQRLNSAQGARAELTGQPGKTGKAPAPGEQQPPVLTAESRLVTCSRCQATFDVDLIAARQQASPGKRLYVTCENPECRFMLDITELAGLKIEPKATEGPAPECFVAGDDGHCAAPGHRQNLPGHICKECAWK